MVKYDIPETLNPMLRCRLHLRCVLLDVIGPYAVLEGTAVRMQPSVMIHLPVEYSQASKPSGLQPVSRLVFL